MRRQLSWVLLSLAGASVELWCSEADAEPAASPPAAADRAAAKKDVRAGDRALGRRDYQRAAQSYERAYARSRSLGALVKAAHASAQAGDSARAANLYAEYLTIAPRSAPQRPRVARALDKLTPKVGRIEIQASGVDNVMVDGAPLVGSSRFVEAGTHEIEGETADLRSVRASKDVAPGTTATVSLAPPPPADPPSPPVAKPVEAPPPPPPANAPERRGGWSPAVAVVGGAATAGLLGLTVWSGLDTVAFRETFDAKPTQQNLDAGDGKQLRTNALIGATAAAAVFTTIAAVVLVDWRAGKKEKEPSRETTFRLGLGTTGAFVTGTF